MKSGRRFVAALCSVSIALSISMIPCKINMSGSTLELAFQSALAKNGGNGNGGSGKGGGDGNGNGKGNDGSNSKSSSDKSSGTSAKGATVEGDTSALGVHHDDGMSEQIKGGRYIMKDARGRTIVNRRATSADEKRLQSLIH
ncbi:hypothetical protein [Pararhizobium sp. A13]|uniref:hypothetical protein n=1 Tax=Pararhizobium sp. A13 TaxID=3133975 RepID=UPI00311B061D